MYLVISRNLIYIQFIDGNTYGQAPFGLALSYLWFDLATAIREFISIHESKADEETEKNLRVL